jgi:hypothetical protein
MQAARKRYMIEFGNVVIDIPSYRSIPQVADECSFAALSNLMMFNARLQPATADERWGAWQRMQHRLTAPQGSTDLGETLDAMSAAYDVAGISYVPLRSRGLSERNVHPVLVHRRQGWLVDIVCSTGALVEGLLDQGCPVAVNFNGHSRVAVGYNAAQLLFADTWGDLTYSCRTISRNVDDVHEGGFSVVDKWVVYSFCRDLCFFREHG